MHDLDLDTQDRSLRREADDLLDRHGVLATLREFGRPHVSGSHSLHLMTWRDLDIYLEMDPVDVGGFLELARRLGHSLRPRKLWFTNHLHFPTTEAVAGLYLGIQTDALPLGGWKLDIWGVAPEVCARRLAHCDSIRHHLDANARRAILRIKNEVCRERGYRDTITSQQVYDAVLLGGAMSISDFRRLTE